MTMTPPVQSLFRPQLKAMQAYTVADAQNLIKLDAMENPYSWPDAIKQEWLTHLQDCAINRYPDPVATALTNSLRKTNRVPVQADILLGNGSDEIIQILLMALQQNSSIMAPEPGFVMYKQVALSLGLNYLGIPLQADFSLDMPVMLNAIKTQQPAVIFLAYPNNPTGNLFAEQDIIDIIVASEGLVVVDEAYAPFTDASFMPKLPEFNNLLVMRTVSKLGLAGLRLGFLAGHSDIITELNKIRLPYNINSLTQLTAEFALNRIDFLITQTQHIRQQRQWLFDRLKHINGLSVYPSEANFILFKSNTIPADTVFQSLKQRGILIKNLSPQGGLLEQCLRVTVGKKDENALFIQRLTQILQP